MIVAEKIVEMGNRTLSLEAVRDINEEARSVELSFSSDAPVLMGWYYEILEHKKNSVDLKRLREMGCLLFNHNRDKVIGRLEKIRVEDGRGKCTAIFDDDEESLKIWQKVRTKTLKGVSVSYRRIKLEREEKMQNDQAVTTYIVKKWEPLEVSIVSVPADSSVGVERDLRTEIIDKREKVNNLPLFHVKVQINKNKLNQIQI